MCCVHGRASPGAVSGAAAGGGALSALRFWRLRFLVDLPISSRKAGPARAERAGPAVRAAPALLPANGGTVVRVMLSRALFQSSGWCNVVERCAGSAAPGTWWWRERRNNAVAYADRVWRWRGSHLALRNSVGTSGLDPRVLRSTAVAGSACALGVAHLGGCVQRLRSANTHTATSATVTRALWRHPSCEPRRRR